MCICKLSQDLMDAYHDYNKLKQALLIESPIYVKMVELETKIAALHDEINNYYHPNSEVK